MDVCEGRRKEKGGGEAEGQEKRAKWEARRDKVRE